MRQKLEALERTQPAVPAVEVPPSQDGLGGELAKVRDILFGSHLLDCDGRFAQLQQQQARVAELCGDLQRQVGLLERELKNEVSVLTEQMRGEREQRRASVEEALDKLSQLRSELDERIQRTDALGEQGRRDLHDQILSQTNALGAALEKRHEEATEMIAQGLRELRSAKTDRATLSGLLADLAKRLQESKQSD